MNARRWWKHIPQYPWIYHYYRRCHISSNLLRSSLSPVPWSHKSFFKWVMSGDSLSAEWNHSPWSIQDSCDRFLDQKDSAGCKCLPQWSTFRCIVFVSIFFVSLSKWKSPMFEQGGQWWTRYQPVSYKLESRYQICQIVQSFFTLAGVGVGAYYTL